MYNIILQAVTLYYIAEYGLALPFGIAVFVNGEGDILCSEYPPYELLRQISSKIIYDQKEVDNSCCNNARSLHRCANYGYI